MEQDRSSQEIPSTAVGGTLGGTVVTTLEVESTAPRSSVAVNVTVYWPGPAYTCVAVDDVPDTTGLPSPKSNAYEVMEPSESDESAPVTAHIRSVQDAPRTAVGGALGATTSTTSANEAVAPRASVTVNVTV